MSNPPVMILNSNWCYLFAENTKASFSGVDVDDSRWIPLPNVTDWTVASSAPQGVDWFRRAVMIEPPGMCANYVLRINRVPEALQVYVNGRLAGEASSGKPFSRDVTDFVAVGRNVLALKLTVSKPNGGGTLGDIRLEQVPCDEDTQV
jgi:hypothetical protein